MIDQKEFNEKLAALVALDLDKAVVFVDNAEERAQLVSALNENHWIADVYDNTISHVKRVLNLETFIRREKHRYLIGSRALVGGFRVPAGSLLVFWDPAPTEVYRDQILARVERESDKLPGMRVWYELFPKAGES